MIWYLKEDKDQIQTPKLVQAVSTRRVGASKERRCWAVKATTEGMLGELTKRENRTGPQGENWGPRGGQLPHEFKINNLPERRQDLVLTNVLSFDVKVWDPEARIYEHQLDNGVQALAPGDPGYQSGGTELGEGAYVDLAYDQTAETHFSGRPPLASKKCTGLDLPHVGYLAPAFTQRDG